ncbi:MAG: hypothetical protein ACOCYP_09585 [Planctomycetota bacterium]
MTGICVRGPVLLLVVLHLLAGAVGGHVWQCHDTACPEAGTVAVASGEHCCGGADLATVDPAAESADAHVTRVVPRPSSASDPDGAPCCAPCELDDTVLPTGLSQVGLVDLPPPAHDRVPTIVVQCHRRDRPPADARPPPHLRWLRTVCLNC